MPAKKTTSTNTTGSTTAGSVPAAQPAAATSASGAGAASKAPPKAAAKKAPVRKAAAAKTTAKTTSAPAKKPVPAAAAPAPTSASVPADAVPAMAAPATAARKGNGQEMPDLGALDALPRHEQEAVLLAETAVELDQARGDRAKMAAALERTVEIWSAIRAFANRWSDGGQIQDVKHNLIRLADFVCGTILEAGTDIAESTVDTLVNINLQISEGLLEGEVNRRIRDRAYQLWEEEGRPHGRDQEHWARAQAEILGR